MLCANRLAQIEKEPALADRLETARNLAQYYETLDIGGDPFNKLHAVLCFVIANNFSKAEQMVAMDRRSGMGTTDTVIRNAINVGPQWWLADKDFFRARQLIEADGKYYPERKHMEAGGLYDWSRDHIDATLMPVLDEAIKYAVARKNRSKPINISDNELLYIPAQLMRSGAEKDARLNTLSMREHSKAHSRYLAETAAIILEIGRRLGAEIPRDILRGHIKAAAGNPNNALPSAGAHPQQEFNLSSIPMPPPVVEQDNDDDFDPQALMQELKTLMNLKKISSLEGRIYLWLNSSDADAVRTTTDAAAKFNIAEKAINQAIDKVGSALDKERKITESGYSERNLHQSRTVRP
ncbi:MAG: hypothetical protein DI551_01340 [Micavibrio aeruginosavorus]|uniref:Uncharacterized protein n=1 Tax=Micavibrio aeruginosavorus TaxID=349221 RepID=A0A2W5QB57_9BACT|nr:MAG: hypothetical protein DI551_01340 [Micavibrio aeruginosavorus]